MVLIGLSFLRIGYSSGLLLLLQILLLATGWFID
jgi:hypothetical protein